LRILMLCEILKIASLIVRNWYYWYMTRVMFPYSVLTNSLVYRYYLISYANWTIVPRDSVTPLFPLRIISQLVALYARWIQMFESHLSVYNIYIIYSMLHVAITFASVKVSALLLRASSRYQIEWGDKMMDIHVY